MRGSRIWAIARKELLSTVRDRRAMISNLLLPLLLLPALMLGIPLLMSGLFEREQETLTRVAVPTELQQRLPPELRSAIEAQRSEIVFVADVLEAVREDDAPAGISFSADLAEAVAANEVPEVQVITKAGNMRGELAAGKVRAGIEAYRLGIVAQRLGQAGLDPSVLQPLQVRQLDASRPEEQASGMLAWLVPFFVAVSALTGAQMTAIDATAGEKERGTLEALLVAPVRRSEVVAGKFLATLATAVSSSVMAVAGVVIGGLLMRGAFLPRLGDEAAQQAMLMGGIPQLSFGGVWLLLISAVLLAGAISALVLAVATFARSFKEAQTYVAPLSFLLIVPAIGLQFADLLDFGRIMYLVPLVNVMLVIDDVLSGSVATIDLLLAWGAMAAVIALLLVFAFRTFQREGVIFRT